VVALAFGWTVPGTEAARARTTRKISPRAAAQADIRIRGAVDVLVRFRDLAGHRERSIVARFGGRVRRMHNGGWISARLPRRQVRKLAQDPAVEQITSDEPIFATMEIGRATAGQPTSAVAESSLKGAGVTIAVIDSGVAQHAEIQTLVASVDLVGHYDPTFDPGRSTDPNGHGTHVAAIMVGDGGHSQDHRLVGVAPEAGLVSLRVLDAQGRGVASDMLAALDWVLDHKDEYGIRVLNLSLGHPVYEPAAADPLVQAVEALWDAGVVVVCSAGNNGRDGYGTISSPCNARKAITVGALNDRNTLDPSDDTVATYSSRGPTAFDRVAKPDLLAPGNKIVAARSPWSHLDQAFPERRVADDPGVPDVKEHYEMSGTSMAAPMVAGAAALMLQQEPWLGPGTVKARLMRSARKVALGNPFVTGAGVLDILGALRTDGEVSHAPSPRVLPESAGGQLLVENTGVLWSNPAFALPVLWSDAMLWSETTSWTDAVIASDGAMSTETEGSALLWPEASLWSEATLWPESTLWSESVLWSDEDDPLPPSVDSQAATVEDP
jgi:serine protease AprX